MATGNVATAVPSEPDLAMLVLLPQADEFVDKSAASGAARGTSNAGSTTIEAEQDTLQELAKVLPVEVQVAGVTLTLTCDDAVGD